MVKGYDSFLLIPMQVSTNESVQWFTASGATSAWSAVFPTALGWMGLVWGDGRLRQATLGHAQAAHVRKALGLLSGKPSEGWRPVVSTAGSPNQFLRRHPSAGQLPRLIERLRRFATQFDDDFADVPLATGQHTEFQRRVLEACRTIPAGQTLTYRELATLAGAAGAARAVGNVMASNRFAPIVPCHRVVASGGGLGGYSAPAGLTLKKRLLQAEARAAELAKVRGSRRLEAGTRRSPRH